MINRDVIYNCWQIYSAGHKIYKSGETTGFRKLQLINDRHDVLNFTVYKINNNVMISAKNESYIYFIFIGSDDPKDWLSNFDFKFHDFDKNQNMKVHDGFYNSSIIFTDIIETESLSFKKANINFIGHSRGGALALISAITFAMNQNYKSTTTNVVTYGQPRVGNHEYIRLLNIYDISYARVIFEKDIVCDVPPIALGYEHPWFGDKIILKTYLWHKIPFLFSKVHLDYERVINKDYIKKLFIRTDY